MTKTEADRADLIAFGRPLISNPDLVERLRANAPLTPPDPATFYGGDEKDISTIRPWRHDRTQNG